MWLCTSRGFVSAVKHPTKPGILAVRAREEEILVYVASQLPGEREILEDDGSDKRKPRRDYRWRLFATHEEFAAFVAVEVTKIDYTNFKNRVYDNARRGLVSWAYEKALHDVWDVFGRIQKGGPYGWDEKKKPRRRGKKVEAAPVEDFPTVALGGGWDDDDSLATTFEPVDADPTDERFVTESGRG